MSGWGDVIDQRVEVPDRLFQTAHLRLTLLPAVHLLDLDHLDGEVDDGLVFTSRTSDTPYVLLTDNTYRA